MRTLQNSKALAGNISMLYHWLWVTVGLGDHIYKSTTYSKNFCRVSSKYSQSVIPRNTIRGENVSFSMRTIMIWIFLHTLYNNKHTKNFLMQLSKSIYFIKFFIINKSIHLLTHRVAINKN